MSIYLPGRTQAEKIAFVVHCAVDWAMTIAAERAKNPSAYPVIPPNAGSAFWARRILGELTDLGIKPDGWELAFMSDYGINTYDDHLPGGAA